jgi:hypothetical protein
MTRNVSVRSQSAVGTRGHTLFTARAVVDIRFTAFQGLGRTTNAPNDNTTFDANGNVTHVGTNQADRYPVNMRHLVGPGSPPANGYQYTFVGNAVTCPLTPMTFRWGLTLHDSHYGLIKDNVVYNWAGAGVVTQDGSESYNVIEHNFVVRVNGTGARDDGGHDGNGFWFRGPNNYVRDNVAANVLGTDPYSYGFNFAFTYVGNRRVPVAPGADPSVDGQFAVVNMNATPIREFARNETYGAIANGLSYWWVNSFGTLPQNGGPSTILDFHVWHHYNWALFGYESNDLTLDGFVARGDAALAAVGNGAIGLYFADYFSRNLVITHADLQGLGAGIIVSTMALGDFTIQDSYFRNVTDTVVGTLWTSAYRGDVIPSRRVVIRNSRFDALPGVGHTAIAMYYDPRDVSNLITPDEVFVYDYNQSAGSNFQLYYTEQNSNFVLLQSTYNSDGTLRRVGSPVAGLTNQQNWNTYGIALAGAVAPESATTMAGISGLVRLF